MWFAGHSTNYDYQSQFSFNYNMTKQAETKTVCTLHYTKKLKIEKYD